MPTQTIGSMKIRTFPVPPRSFDPATASASELRRYGLPPRPDSVEHPWAAAKWVRAFRHYAVCEPLTPKIQGMNHRHGPNRRTRKGTEAHVNSTSLNWSGSVLHI